MMGLIQFGMESVAAMAAMIPLQPPAASSIAGEVDQLYYLLTGITLFFTVLIFSIIFYFMVKYRRRSPDEKPPEVHSSLVLELALDHHSVADLRGRFRVGVEPVHAQFTPARQRPPKFS